MMGKVLEVHLTHKTFETSMHLGYKTRRAGVNFYADEFHLFPQPHRIGRVT
jgi:hypothetical protein